jgi:nucleotide-binding universal stress UspA family protein
MSLTAWIVAPAWIVAGICIYHFYSKSHAISTEDEIHVIEEEKAPKSDQYSIMVAVANPDNAIKMIRTTYYVGEAKKAQVQLLHMVPVPEQVPLSDAEKFMMEGKEGIVEAMLCLILRFPITTTIRYCRNIARGILSAVREKKTDMLIMGWHGKPGSYAFRLGSTLDAIMERAPCRVLILKDTGNQEYKSILVPVGEGPNSIFSLEIANIIAEKDDAEIIAMIVNDEKKKIDISPIEKAIRSSSEVNFERLKIKLVNSPNTAAAILEEAQKHDLLIMGSSLDPLVYHMTRDSVIHAVAKKYDKPMIIAKASGGIKSWIKRWL